VLKTSKGRFHVDYGFHLAPMDGTAHRRDPELIEKHGVSSFKIFMFYGSHGLHGASATAQRDFLMIGEDERYDYAHFEFVMRGIQAARENRCPSGRADLALLHCETAEVMTAYTKIIEKDKSQKGLAGLPRVAPAALRRAGGVHRRYLANETALPNINLLHLSLAQGGAGRDDDGRRVPAHRLQARGDHRPPDARHHVEGRRAGQGQPADPPARGRRVPVGGAAGRRARLGGQRPRLLPPRDEDPQALLRQHLDGQERLRRHRVPAARAGQRRHEARHGLQPHGARDQLEPGAALRPEPQGRHRRPASTPTSRWSTRRKTWTIAAKDSPSTQGYTPFEGLELSARVEETFLRGMKIYQGGEVIGKPRGQYLHRPDGMTRRPFAPGPVGAAGR
jgi:allantoinase